MGRYTSILTLKTLKISQTNHLNNTKNDFDSWIISMKDRWTGREFRFIMTMQKFPVADTGLDL